MHLNLAQLNDWKTVWSTLKNPNSVFPELPDCSFIESTPPKTKRPARKQHVPISSKRRKEIDLDTEIQQKPTTSRAQAKRKQTTQAPTSTRYKRYKEIPEFLKLTSDEEMSDSSESSQYDIEHDDLDHQPLFNLPKRNNKMPQAEEKFESNTVSDEDDELMHAPLFRPTKKSVKSMKSNEFQMISSSNKRLGQPQVSQARVEAEGEYGEEFEPDFDDFVSKLLVEPKKTKSGRIVRKKLHFDEKF